MIHSSFTNTAQTQDLYQEILSAISRLNPAKLAAHSDLDHCFDQDGYLARIHEAARFSSLREEIIRHNHEHRRALPLPIEHAYPHTLSVIQKNCQMSEREMRIWEDQIWAIRATGLELPLDVTIYDRLPEKLNLFYLGDYVQCVDRVINLGACIDESVRRGEEQKVLNAIAALAALPDYSPYFHDKAAPRGGMKTDCRPLFAAYVPQPV